VLQCKSIHSAMKIRRNKRQDVQKEEQFRQDVEGEKVRKAVGPVVGLRA